MVPNNPAQGHGRPLIQWVGGWVGEPGMGQGPSQALNTYQRDGDWGRPGTADTWAGSLCRAEFCGMVTASLASTRRE